MYSMPGKKYDNNKPSIGLIDPDFLTGLAKVLDFGREKYGVDNWRNGIHVSRIISACYRHLGEINKRNDVDSESNLPAVYHLASEVMFLAWMLENKKEYDDRYQKATSGPLTPQRETGEPYLDAKSLLRFWPGGKPMYSAEFEQIHGQGTSRFYNWDEGTKVAAQGWNLGEHPA